MGVVVVAGSWLKLLRAGADGGAEGVGCDRSVGWKSGDAGLHVGETCGCCNRGFVVREPGAQEVELVGGRDVGGSGFGGVNSISLGLRHVDYGTIGETQILDCVASPVPKKVCARAHEVASVAAKKAVTVRGRGHLKHPIWLFVASPVRGLPSRS
jgi:hypothetical protein